MEEFRELGQRTDEELIEDVKGGSMESFRVLYERYKVKIFNYIYSLIGDRQGAEDCTHDVFIHLYKKAALYSPTAKFSSWLYRMAKNMVLDMLRKKQVRKAMSLEAEIETSEGGGSLLDVLASEGQSPAKVAESEEMVNLVRLGITKLSEIDRQIIVLCDIQGLSHRQVGEILGYPEQTVTVKLYRARRRLADILKSKEFWKGKGHG